MQHLLHCAAGNALRAERFASTTREDDKLGVLAIENFFGVNIADLHDLGVVVRILDMLKAALARACRLPDELWDVGDQIDACTRAARDGDRAALGTGWAAFTARIWAPIAIGSKQKLPVSRDGLAATLVDFFASSRVLISLVMTRLHCERFQQAEARADRCASPFLQSPPATPCPPLACRSLHVPAAARMALL